MAELSAGHGLKHTPLYDLHVRLGARMVPFAGYEMPVQYPTGIIKEHLHTRAAAGLFDVSHMGQIALRPRSGRIIDAARALEALVPADVLSLAQGRQRYAFFTNDFGGVLDDLMVSNQGDHFTLVVNAARKDADEAHLRAHLSASCVVEAMSDRALVALQGPQAEAALAFIAPDVRSMRFMDVRSVSLFGGACTVSRSGYTGEDGFEISVKADKAEELCVALLNNDTVAPVGLGARDSLRLEAGLCLYGSDLDPGITPVEAGLEWAIQKTRRGAGRRAGGFPGADVILTQLERGAARRRVGLKPDGRAPVRGGTPLFLEEDGTTPIGIVTSGGFGISLGAPIAMGYVPVLQTTLGARLFADVRGKRLPVRVCELPFVSLHYERT
jgi:glycine cleavage system T protein (aminomethyltransferase)